MTAMIMNIDIDTLLVSSSPVFAKGDHHRTCDSGGMI